MAALGNRFNIVISDHASIANEDQALEPKSLVQVVDGLARRWYVHRYRPRRCAIGQLETITTATITWTLCGLPSRFSRAWSKPSGPGALSRCW